LDVLVRKASPAKLLSIFNGTLGHEKAELAADFTALGKKIVLCLLPEDAQYQKHA
jgi:hypothetical protein